MQSSLRRFNWRWLETNVSSSCSPAALSRRSNCLAHRARNGIILGMGLSIQVRLFPAVLALSLALQTGCLEPLGSVGAPFRSPSNDYRPPPPTTSDGEVVGADRRAPADKLAEGPTNSGAAPGWKVNSQGVTYDPKARVGGEIDRSQSKPNDARPASTTTSPHHQTQVAPSP